MYFNLDARMKATILGVCVLMTCAVPVLCSVRKSKRSCRQPNESRARSRELIRAEVALDVRTKS